MGPELFLKSTYEIITKQSSLGGKLNKELIDQIKSAGGYDLNKWIDLNENDYHLQSDISFHGLVQCLKSYEHYLAYKASSFDSPTLRFGRLAHLMALEPVRFKSNVRLMPEVDLRTKAGKEEMARFKDDCKESDILVKPDEFQRLMGMRAKLDEAMECPDLGWIFESISHVERSAFFKFGDTVAKMRPDMVGESYILDYKTTSNAWIWKFQRDAKSYYYDLQLFFYQYGESLISGKTKELYILAQETEPPYEFQTYKIDHSFRDEAINIINQAYQKYIYGVSGTQRGYPRSILQLDMTRGY